jgi:hypothetical protein
MNKTLKNLVGTWWVWMAMSLFGSATAADYYVDQNYPSASDANGGTASAPWKTINKANQTLRAGDTVSIKAGTYNTYIEPVNSGTASGRITYKNYGSDVVVITGTRYAVFLDSKDYISIQGITATNCVCFVYMINGSDHNVLGYSTFDKSSDVTMWDVSVIYGSSQYNHIHHCRFSKGGECTDAGSDDGQVLDIGSESSSTDLTRYNLVENCVFFHGGHHLMGLMGGYNTIRNNYFHNEAWSRGCGNRTLYLNGQDVISGHNVIEGNRFGYAAKPCDDVAVGDVAMSTAFNLFRHNKLYHNNAYALGFSTYSGYSAGSSNRVYNNTMFNEGYNIYPPYAGSSQDCAVMFFYSQPAGNALKNNLYFKNNKVYGISGNSLANHTFANNWDGDTQGDPLFVNAPGTPPADMNDATLPNLDLRSGSPALDKGGALTTVAAADTGSGTSLIVADGTYFQDGTRAPAGTVQADWVAVGSVGNVAQIASISGNTLTLVGAIARNDNDPVWLYKRSDGTRVLFGSNPDAGAVEFGDPAPVPPTGLRIVGP